MIEELRAGVEGVSRWVVVTQEQVDAHAATTGDTDWLHVDPERAAASEYGGTIVQGSLQVAVVVGLSYEALPAVARAAVALNYGFDRLRFPAALRTGSRVRLRARVTGVRPRDDGAVVVATAVALEAEGAARPSLVADWLFLLRP